MLKHRGFPSRLSGTDLQFTIRRPSPRGVTEIKIRKRFADRRPMDRAADEAFLAAIYEHFGQDPFPRGNLDAGRLSWLFGREILPVEEPFDAKSYDALLRIDLNIAKQSFSDVFAKTGT
ncbi:MAG: hypothetical protein AAGG56_07415 [Pseudomonadota bacterium]